jgi:hypothetical protein
MPWTTPPRRPEVLLHYSEDATITRFAPHVPRSNPTQSPAVWASDPPHAPLYWFPRDCPRVAVWANDATQQSRLSDRFASAAARLHAAPLAWLDAVGSCTLFEYRFDPAPFTPWPEAEGQWVTSETVEPVAVEAVGDLLARHIDAGVELRFVDDLAPLRDAVLEAGLPFSIVRYRSES